MVDFFIVFMMVNIPDVPWMLWVWDSVPKFPGPQDAKMPRKKNMSRGSWGETTNKLIHHLHPVAAALFNDVNSGRKS